MRAIVVCLLILLCLLPTLSHNQDYEVSVTNVNVWVRVVDRSGNPVMDMKKEDFEIFEDGKKVSSECFEEFKLKTPDVGTTEVFDNQAGVRNTSKRFVLFLDLQNTTQVEFERIRPRMDEFLDQLSKANWDVMLVAYLASGKLGVVSPFTRDYVRIGALLDQAKGNSQRDQRIARNQNEIMQILSVIKVKNDSADVPDPENGLQQESGGGQGSGSRGQGSGPAVDKHFFALAVSSAYRQAQLYARQERNEGENSFGALESFGEYYGKRLSDGEHSIILFLSGGISSDPGRRYFDLVNGFVANQAGNINSPEFSLNFTDSNK
ncbi:MAG TPA: hypothetical protein VLH08_05340, partial [Acidobacteriota bacterium]|nr:hypothetical protein [Acidobacteriota bacterium]